jgi:hypothetical protein
VLAASLVSLAAATANANSDEDLVPMQDFGDSPLLSFLQLRD